MKLTFTVTLELSVPESYTLTEHDIRAYRDVLANAVAYQMQFCGFTPDHLSDEDVGVDSFYAELDARRTQAANGEAFALWWTMEDIQNHAANLGETLTAEEVKAVLRQLEHDADASTGVSWAEVTAAIDFVLGR